MRSEYTRQTRWASGLKLIDAEQVPPASTYARQMIWVPCADCDLQVHDTCANLLVRGVRCPECGRRLAEPLTAEEQEEAVRKVCEQENWFRQRLQS